MTLGGKHSLPGFEHLIMITRSLEQITHLIESITEDIIYVPEAKEIRHAGDRKRTVVGLVLTFGDAADRGKEYAREMPFH